jgi:hypothetical protein
LVETLECRCVPATITPTTFADGGLGSGSLRDAVLQFNADTGTDDDIIQLEAGTYALTIPNVGGRHETAGLTGDLNLTQTSHRWIIQGAGPSTIIDAGQLQDRVFQIVNPGTQVVFQNLAIQGGLAQDNGSDGALARSTDALGGGILNNGGNVTLSNVVLQDNVARGGDAASLGAAGHNASGGGIHSTGGALTMAGATIANNQATGGRGGDHTGLFGLAGPGGSGNGGGLYATGGSLDISDSRIANNRATGGTGGDGNFSTTSAGHHNGGAGGRGQGGGLWVNGGSLTLASSTIASNQGTGGSPGRFGQSPGEGLGGGLSSGGTLTVTGSTLSRNSASRSGGGIYNLNIGTLTVTDSTFSGNSAIYGGGGIANLGTLTVTNCTLSGNSATFSTGGGISEYPSATTHCRNSLLAGNTAPGSPDLGGTLTSQGHNLIGDGTGGSGYDPTDLVGTSAAPIDPLLGPLQDNGGPTQTHALLPGSPAIDAGNNVYASMWDQRGPGFPRIIHGTIDIGAFEYHFPRPVQLNPNPVPISEAGPSPDMMQPGLPGSHPTFDLAVEALATAVPVQPQTTVYPTPLRLREFVHESLFEGSGDLLPAGLDGN